MIGYRYTFRQDNSGYGIIFYRTTKIQCHSCVSEYHDQMCCFPENPEPGYLYPVGGHEDVGRLQVPVDNLVSVEVLQPGQHADPGHLEKKMFFEKS